MKIPLKKDSNGSVIVTDFIIVGSGHTRNEFNFFENLGVDVNEMPVTSVGIGQDSGYAALHVRSKGAHYWGDIPGHEYEPSKSFLMLSASDKDDNNNDITIQEERTFSEILFAPYSPDRVGVEWTTAGAIIKGTTTQPHTESVKGTKIILETTENDANANQYDWAHTTHRLHIHAGKIWGTTASDTEIGIDTHYKDSVLEGNTAMGLGTVTIEGLFGKRPNSSDDTKNAKPYEMRYVKEDDDTVSSYINIPGIGWLKSAKFERF